MAYNRNLYSSDTDALDAGIIYDQNELMMQDEVNAAIKNGDLIVGQADNLASKMNQFSTGEFIERTTGGDASLSDGDGHLVLIRGNMVHTGYLAKSVNMTVTPIERDPSAGEFTAQIDDDLFLAEMQDTSGTMVFTYGSSGWDYDPANYGITTDGLALPGDVISVAYQKEVRGTITQSDPQTFVSIGWNLYDHSKGYARVLYYNDNPRFGITGTYTSVQYSLSITGAKSSVTPDANGTFGIPTDGNGGYIWVNGGNDTDTAVWMCWTDWTNDQTGKEPNGGVWEAYSESEIDLSTIMATYFVNGLMAVGSYHDEIDLSLGKVTANVGKMTYTEENLDDVIEMGVEYDYDTSYIYYGLTEPIVAQVSIDNTYAAYDHGIEFFTGTEVPIYSQTLYGINLKNRLERDVVTISQQTLSASEQAQVATNIGAVKKSGDTMSGNLTIADNQLQLKNTSRATGSTSSSTNYNHIVFLDSNNYKSGELYKSYGGDGRSALTLRNYQKVGNTDVVHYIQMAIDSEGNRSVSVNDKDAWCDGLGVVKKAGDTMTGILNMKTSLNPFGTLPTSEQYITAAAILDKDGGACGTIQANHFTDGRYGVAIQANRTVNGTYKSHALRILIKSDGSQAVSFPAAPWRSQLGLGTSGELPITITQGGTGQTQVTATSTKTNVCTAGSGVTISTAYFAQWGKVALLHLSLTSSNAISANTWTTLATLKTGKIPVYEIAGDLHSPCVTANIRLRGTGAVDIRSATSIAASTTIVITGTYLLAN